MTLMVKKGVKLPPPDRNRRVARKYPLDTMKIGEMFFVPNKNTAHMSSYVAKVGKKLSRRFKTQTITMRQDLQTEEWEPCKVGAVGSKKGCAVERLA